MFARSRNTQEDDKLKEILLKYHMTECRVLLEDINLGKHAATINDRKKKFTCYVCMAKFSTAKEMSKHRSLHSESDTGTETEDDLFVEDGHQMTLKSKSPPSLTAETQKSHKNSTEATDKKPAIVSSDKLKGNAPPKDNPVIAPTPFKCETCQVFFENGDGAKTHKASKKCKFSCKICKRKFNTLYAFLVHIMQHKANTEKNRMSTHYAYECTLCGKLFDDCFQLMRHENMTHKLTPNPTLNNPDSPTLQPNHLKKQETGDDTLNNPDSPTLQPKYLKKQETGDDNNSKIITPGQGTEEVGNELQSNAEESEQTEITCDLCYDVFKSNEELKSHMDFHKQLENKSDTILIDDDEDDVVEVIEDKRDAHDIRATITKSSLLKSSLLKPSNPSTSSKGYAILTPVYPNNNASGHRPVLSAASQERKEPGISKQILTATITDMLTPTHEKQSKTILLNKPSQIPCLTPIKKLSKRITIPQQTASTGTSSDLELRKTGPLSYSFTYKQGHTKQSPQNAKMSPAVTNLQVLSSTNDANNAVTGLSKTISTESILNTNVGNRNIEKNIKSSSKICVNPNNNYRLVIKSITNAEPSTASSSPPGNVDQTAPADSTRVPTITSSIVPNAPTNISSVLPSFPKNFAYLINNPTNNSTFPQISTFTDPSTQIAYFIIPHGNSKANAGIAPSNALTAVSSTSAAAAETAAVSALASGSTRKMAETPTTEKSNKKPCKVSKQQPIGNVPDKSSLSSSKNINPYNVQMPLITNVTSLQAQSNYTLPVISNVTSILSVDENSAHSKEYVSPSNTSSTTTTTANSKSISSYMISKPGPSTETDEPAIIIDSDSSRDSTDCNISPIKVAEKKSGNDSDSNGSDLIIDENAANKNDAKDVTGPEPKMGFIFVRNLSELMDPQNTDKDKDLQNTDKEKDLQNTDKEKDLQNTDKGKDPEDTDKEINPPNTDTKINDKPINAENTEQETSPGNANEEINQDDDKSKEKKGKRWKFPMNCDSCSVVFQRFRAFRNHNERKLKCKLCDFKCCKVVSLKEHYTLEHRKFYCGRCSYVADNKYQFRNHNGVHHTCKYCSGLYANLSSHNCVEKDKNVNKDSAS